MNRRGWLPGGSWSHANPHHTDQSHHTCQLHCALQQSKVDRQLVVGSIRSSHEPAHLNGIEVIQGSLELYFNSPSAFYSPEGPILRSSTLLTVMTAPTINANESVLKSTCRTFTSTTPILRR
jgi:hypothetical protein